MIEVNIDTTKLNEFKKEIISFAVNEYPKETKKFVRKEGKKLSEKTKDFAGDELNVKTGNYLKGIKVSKAYSWDHGDTIATKVFAGRPAYHAHLIEYGHYIYSHGKNTGKRTRAFEIFTKSAKEYENTFGNNAERFLGEILNKI